MTPRLPAILICLVMGLTAEAQHSWKHGRLKVNSDGSDLQYEDGTPFFWLGDTAWELCNRLNSKEIAEYLDDRAAKGFNVIQVTAISTSGIRNRNRNGEVPLTDSDPFKPNEKYFAFIDTVIQLALERDMFIGFVATWGDKVVNVPGYGVDPVIFDKLSAQSYGKWLGNRYRNSPNIIWILGGDVAPVQGKVDYRPEWSAMAEGIIESTAHRCLITYHPPGYRSSSEWFHDASWLDFNMIQSSHGEHDAPTWEMVDKDKSRTPVKPTLDAEPNYEDHPVHPWPKWNPDSSYFRDYDVRKQMYRSVFAGAFGVTYGHHAVWQFMSEREEVSNFADRGWRNALARPGSFQAGYLRKLMESRPGKRVRDLTLIAEGQGHGKNHIESFRSINNDFAMIYLPVGRSVTIDMRFIKSKKINAWWFNPKIGMVTKLATLDRIPSMKFSSPTSGDQNDWVLILDDASKHLSDLNEIDFVMWKK